MAAKIAQRIAEIKAADSVAQLLDFHLGRCHPLKGDRNGQYAMDLCQPYRLVFIEKENTFEVVKIISIEDYH